MPEFTGNVHNLQLTLPFPAPVGSTGPMFVLGRVFGDPPAGTDGLDVWVHDTATTSYDPPDGPAVTNLPVSSLLAVTHGWLRFVPGSSQVPGLTSRTNSPLIVAGNALVLSVWPTLRDNLEQMVTLGSVLVPDVAAGRGGRPALEHLVYDNVDMTTLRPAIEKLVAEARPGAPATDAERTAMVDAFLAGTLPILARAGRVIGQAGAGVLTGVTPPAPAGATWRRVTLRALDRLGQLFDPGWFLRRIQELADVTEIPVVVDKTLIPSRASIRDHSLPKLTPARQIVDWRDAHLRPRANRAFLLAAGTDPSGTTPKTTGAWGVWVGPTLAAGVEPLDASTVTVGAVDDHVAVGTLPNADRSAFRLTRHLLNDDYLVLSELDLAEWFPARPPSTPPVEPLRRYTQGNRVTAFADGRDGFWPLFQAMRRTFRDEDYAAVGPEGPLPPEGALLPATARAANKVYVAGWQLSPNLFLLDLPETYTEVDFDAAGTPLGTGGWNPRGHVMGILRAAIDTGVQVRALLWRQLEVESNFHTNNTAAVNAINAVNGVGSAPRGQAILDAVGRTVGAHHQKAVVVANADGRFAFLGGLDLALLRRDSTEHRPNDPRSQDGRAATAQAPWHGWHDVHCRVEGPAVDDVETNFRQRWNSHPQAQTEGRTLTPGRSTPLDPLPGGSHFVQINRTLPKGVPTWSFVAPDAGEAGALTARRNAILHARRYVHLEEQYLTMVDPADYTALMASPSPLTFTPSAPETVSAALRARLVGADPIFATILIPRTLIEVPQFANRVIYELRRRFIAFVTHGLTDQQKRDRLLVFHRRNASGVSTYVHAKTMLVDDLWASVGSSNCGYRSMTYDTEINCDVVDGAIERGRRRYPTDLRVRLWAEHLGLAPNERHLVLDPRAGFELLRRAAEDDWPRPHSVQAYDPAYNGDDLGAPGAPPLYDPANATHEVLRTHLIDPDGGNPDDPALDYAALLQLLQTL